MVRLCLLEFPETLNLLVTREEIWGRKQDLPDLLFSELLALGSEW